jgi:hypothetical protein
MLYVIVYLALGFFFARSSFSDVSVISGRRSPGSERKARQKFSYLRVFLMFVQCTAHSGRFRNIRMIRCYALALCTRVCECRQIHRKLVILSGLWLRFFLLSAGFPGSGDDKHSATFDLSEQRRGRQASVFLIAGEHVETSLSETPFDDHRLVCGSEPSNDVYRICS